MASTFVDSLKLATNESTIYGGFFVFIIGMIGNILNIIIFTSLKTFRETSAAFCMNVTSVVNIFQLVVGLLSRILITGYNIDLTKTSNFLCKGRGFTLTTTMLISFTFKCFVVIDQYLSLTDRYRHLCNVKVASRLIIIASIAWCLHGISIWILQGVYPVSSTNQTSCSIADPVFRVYMSRFILAVLLGFLPLIIRITFGLLAFLNVRDMKNRGVPIVRLERDKQLTTMVLVEVFVDVVLILPYSIYNHLYSNIVTFSDPFTIAQNQLIGAIIRLFFYGSFSVSSRFRKQVIYVLIEIHLKHWREKINRYTMNQIAPQLTIDGNTVSIMKLSRN